MSFRALVLILALMVICESHAAPPPELARQAAEEGLVAVRSRRLDIVYLHRDKHLSAYKRFMIDPVRVDFDERWLKYHRATVPAVDEQSVKRIAEDIAGDARESIAEAFRARGFEISSVPGPGVLRLSPGVSDLYVNAPERMPPWNARAFTKEAGEALLLLDVRDSTTNTVVARVAHRGIATQMGRFSWATDVSNRMWFGELIRRWAGDCAGEIERRPANQ
jgi:hypothetical protein